jgi:predicted nucleic acid-binding Zn finger protein
MSYLLSTLRSATPERHQLAVKGLRDGTFTVTIAFRTEQEIRALVKNGDGHEYGVNLSARGNFCSCKDALYRGATCKHQLALAVHVLQQNEQAQDRVHLMFPDGAAALCGEQKPRRVWQRWTLNALHWSDLVCQQCVQAWLHPREKLPTTRAEHFALPADGRQLEEVA